MIFFISNKLKIYKWGNKNSISIAKKQMRNGSIKSIYILNSSVRRTLNYWSNFRATQVERWVSVFLSLDDGGDQTGSNKK